MVDDEAAVGAAAGGAVEVGDAVGVAADDVVGERAGHEQVAGVRERVAEAEHGGVVLRGAAAALGDPRQRAAEEGRGERGQQLVGGRLHGQSVWSGGGTLQVQ